MRRVLIFSLLLASMAVSPVSASSAEKGKQPADGLTYIALPTLTASIVRGDGRRRVLTVQAGLDVADAALRQRAELSQPRLRDAYVGVLSAYAASAPALGPPDPDTIGTILQRATNQVLGRAGANLLLGTIMIN